MFETSDLSLATTLLCYGFKLVDTNKTNPKRIVFIFDKTGELYVIDDVVKAYFAKQTSVEPSYFFSQIKFLKSQIYAVD